MLIGASRQAAGAAGIVITNTDADGVVRMGPPTQTDTSQVLYVCGGGGGGGEFGLGPGRKGGGESAESEGSEENSVWASSSDVASFVKAALHSSISYVHLQHFHLVTRTRCT